MGANVNNDSEVVSRRGFLAGSVSTAAALAGTAALAAPAAKPAPAKPAAAPKPAPAKPSATAKPAAPVGPTVTVGVIGLGLQGREILASLSRLGGVNVAAVCDKYQPFLNRAKESAPKADGVADYNELLGRKDVQGVFIATPTHAHREIALAALQAGKHVYCEAPLAHTIEDAKAIANAARSSKQIFQVGQQNRANPQHHHVAKFIRGNAVLGELVGGRGQWHKRESWRRPAPTDERQREMNWRLDRKLANGLIGEIGIHALDVANWYFNEVPASVSGWGSNLAWKDGRSIPDTVTCAVEYPSGARFVYDITLANSYDGAFETFMGPNSAVLMRGQQAWLFKEADAPLQGWEVYARKEQYGSETGICLVADASKQLSEGKLPGQEKAEDTGKTPLYFSCEAFLNSIRDPKKTPDCGPIEGYRAVVTSIKANEAILSGSKITFQKEWFEL